MRYSEVLCESRMAPLYHHMDDEKAIEVFAFDSMEGRWDHNIPGFGMMTGTSFTRNKRLDLTRPVSITVDQQRLAERYRIIPLDGELVFRHTHRLRPLSDRSNRLRGLGLGDQLAEEFVIGTIKPLHRYVTRIDLRATLLSEHDSWELYQATRKFAKKWQIPLRVDPVYLQRQKARLARWREDQEDEADAANA